MGRKPKIREQDKTWDDYEKFLRRDSLSQKRIDCLRYRYEAVCRGIGINKPLDKCDKKTIELFVDDLTGNKFHKLNGKPYTGETKQAIKAFLKQYFKWRFGMNETYPEQVSWIKTKISKDERAPEKPALTLHQAVKLANGFKKAEYHLLTLLLFDSGFRIGEMRSVRKSDLTWDSYKESESGTESCFWIHCRQSKTEVRNIPIPLFTKEVEVYLNSASMRSREDDELFPKFSYRSYAARLSKLGRKMFNLNITPHIMRHSSATHYAEILNTQSLAMRYGWTFNSKELNTYIKRSKNYHKLTAVAVYQNNAARLQDQINDLKTLLERVVEVRSPQKSFSDEQKKRFDK